MARSNNNDKLHHLCRVIRYNSAQLTDRTSQHHCQRILTHETSSELINDGVKFRLATEADFEAICHMSRLAHKERYKLDYLPGWFPRALKDPNRVLCVGEKDGNIVGFVMGIGGVDSGKTILWEAGRIHPGHQGQGHLFQYYGYILSQLLPRYPHVERLRGSGIFTDVYDTRSDLFHIIKQCTYIETYLSGDKFNSFIIASTPSMSIRRLSGDELGGLLSDVATTSQLYPEGLISLGYNVFDPDPNNVSFITYFNDNIFLSRDKRAISIGCRFPCDDDRAWMYFFNYSGTTGVQTAVGHLVRHLCLYGGERQDKDTYIAMSMPKAFEEAGEKEALCLALENVLGVPRESISLRTMYHLTDTK